MNEQKEKNMKALGFIKNAENRMHKVSENIMHAKRNLPPVSQGRIEKAESLANKLQAELKKWTE